MKHTLKKWAVGAIFCTSLLGSAQSFAAANTTDGAADLSVNQASGSQTLSYHVKWGDSLWKLSRRYRSTVQDIQQANQLQGTMIYVGQVLQIPVGSREKVAAAEYHPAEYAKEKAPADTVDSQTVKTLNCVATAYGPSDIAWQWGGMTATGKRVAQGMIAVDPNVIPLGSKVWISGYNDPNLPAGGFMATAEDTGGAIRGNRIDIYINTDANSLRNFGMQNVSVKVLK